MIEFKNKDFSEKGKKVFNTVKDVGSIAGPIMAGTGLAVNFTRKNNEENFQKEQIEATNRLAAILEEVDKKEAKKKTSKRSEFT